MKQRRIEDYGNMVQRLYARDTAAENRVCCRNITFQVTSGCNLRCSYCYEHHKSIERMSIETGRKAVDYILDLYEKNESDFVNQNTRAVVLDFIGGEPLLEAKLIEHICDYWFSECYRREIPLAPFVDDDHWHYDVFSCKSGEKQVGSISSDYAQTGSFDLNDKATWSWHYIRKMGKLGAEAMMYEKFNGSGSTYVRAAFVSPSSAGVYAPWRGGALYDGAGCGLPCASGSSGPGTAYWYGVPRLAGSGKKRG